MRIPNYLMSTLAIVGAFSLIVMACSADNAVENTTATAAAGKYQGFGGESVFHVIDTETGMVKSYEWDSGTQKYLLLTTTKTQ